MAVGRKLGPRRDLSGQHRKVLAFLCERAGGADGKTAWCRSGEIATALNISSEDLSISLSSFENKKMIEPIRSQDGERILFTGFRVLRLLPGMNGDIPHLVTSKPILESPQPATPRLDEVLAALDVTESAFAGAGANIKFLPIVDEAIALRRWVRDHMNGRRDHGN